MFISVGKAGERYCSFEDEEKFLRELSTSKDMFCPDCNELVRFRAGTRAPHFYHDRKCTNPNPYTEPESETHRNGKLAIYSWLKSLYRESEVALEYYIPETKQRSDVMLIHPDGEKWAFEFQCSKIAGVVWNERHELYEQAGVKDFWILNSELIQNISEKDFKVIGLESAVYRDGQRLIYLDVNEQIVHFHIDGDLWGGTLSNPKVIKDALANFEIRKKQLWLSAYDTYLKELEEEREASRQEQLRYDREKEEREKSEYLRKQIENEKKTRNIRDYYKRIIEERHKLTADMTYKEKELFLRLTKKYDLTPDNFPAVFMLEVGYSDLLLTPKQLWQLWIYDYVVSKWDGFIKKGKESNIWFDYMKEKFKEQKDIGVFRTVYNRKEEANYMFTVYNYLARLNQVGVLQKLGSMTTKYQRLLVNRIPILETHNENALLKLFFEGYFHETTDEVGIKYTNKVKEIQWECHQAKR
ncbi:hypothetical protein BK120_14930 [Paenibacillus sp. FSL A5-0031]|uniref:competence protein CoiA n=1 Tax=Paenibacillus sp. FSL A5-0031 TaxID=1920420 RepID=UPI00096F3D8E|nr:competence protein CoiA family protein [Paenibacillus sp. FSL A5-0031]OME83093.1 hypothetical protein BK120_14930 [Paenibacillus sp. FSL A5-0031]